MDSKFVNWWCRMVYGKDLKAGKLVMKIDLLVMTYVCLTQFVNLLGKCNLGGATNGMSLG